MSKELKKDVLGMWGLAFLTVAALYPMAMGVSNAAAAVTYGGLAAPLILVIGALLILFMSIPVLEYARLTQFAGGYYGLCELGFGKGVGKYVALVNLLYFIFFDVLTASAFAFIIYTSLFYLAGYTLPSWAFVLLSLGVLVALYGINTFNLSVSAKLVILSGILQLIVMIVFGAIVIARTPYNTLRAFDPSEAPGGLGGVMLGTILAGFLFYTGYGVPLFFAEESKAAFKSVWRSIALGVIVPTLVGIFAVYSEVVAMNPANVGSLANDWNPAVVAYLPYLGLGGAILYVAVALLGQAFGAFVPGMGSARLIYSMARDNFIDSEWLRKVHPKYGTPANAGLLNLVVGALATLLVEGLMFSLYGYHQGVFNSVLLAGSMVVAYWFLHHMIPDVSLAFLYRRFGVKILALRNFLISVVAPGAGLALFIYSFYEGYSSLSEPYLGGFIFFAASAVVGAIYVWNRARRGKLGESMVLSKINDELLKKLRQELPQRETR